MPYLKVSENRDEPVNIYYEDWGQGRPIVLIHGWPLNNEMWEYQANALLDAGFRVVKYDRRGFGKSSRPDSGYDYDTMTEDLKKLLDHLDLQDAFLVGFSMGGGEVARYFGRYGSERVSRVALVSAVTPSVKKTPSNPDGVPQDAIDGIMDGLKDDRMKFLAGFNKDFFGVGFLNQPISDELMHYYAMQAGIASPLATRETAKAWANTDFIDDCKKITVPTLIIHGTEDQTVPIATAGDRAAKLIPSNTYLKYDGAPHGLFYTEKEKFNKDLLEFARMPVAGDVTV